MTPITVTVSNASGGVQYSPLVRLDEWAPGQVGVQLTASGTVNYTLQQSMDDPNSPTNPVAQASMTWVNCADTSAVGASSTVQTNYQLQKKIATLKQQNAILQLQNDNIGLQNQY